MTKPMSHRDAEKALLRAGAIIIRTKGGHDVWRCPCGQHTTALPRHTTISAGVVGSIGQQLACLPKGWLS